MKLMMAIGICFATLYAIDVCFCGGAHFQVFQDASHQLIYGY